eukprot:scaffold105299_cov19-Tisochrysis_lutea.AAC.1
MYPSTEDPLALNNALLPRNIFALHDGDPKLPIYIAVRGFVFDVSRDREKTDQHRHPLVSFAQSLFRLTTVEFTPLDPSEYNSSGAAVSQGGQGWCSSASILITQTAGAL